MVLRLQGITTTTHIDRHGQRFSLEALEENAKQHAREYIPILWNHDLRFPLGRSVGSQLIPLADGEFGLQTSQEIWEPEDTPESMMGDGRHMVLRDTDVDGLGVAYDLGYENGEGRA